MIGVIVRESFRFPFPIKIKVGNIGGPSAGLMFALGIVDKLTPGNLTGGRFVAGTGEIEANGAVAPIGGIQQKMAGARDAGATLFLTPAANCADAVGRRARRAAPDQGVHAAAGAQRPVGDQGGPAFPAADRRPAAGTPGGQLRGVIGARGSLPGARGHPA